MNIYPKYIDKNNHSNRFQTKVKTVFYFRKTCQWIYFFV